MPMNRVQFQKGLSRPEFMDRCGTEEQCELALSTARWPGGFVCPACGVMHSRTSFRRDGRLYWQLQAMVLAESDRQLSGRVEIDDAYLGGERSGGKGGRGTQNKMAFVVAVQTNDAACAHLACLSARPFTKEAM